MKRSANKPYYHYSASLRIFGKKINFNEISDKLGIKPTVTHHRGEKASKISRRAYKYDIWILNAAVSRESHLEKHLLWLKKKLMPHKEYIHRIKKKYHVDIFCGYRSNCDQGGLSLSPESLALFLELGITFELSIIVI